MSHSNALSTGPRTRQEAVVQALEQIIRDRSITAAGRVLAQRALEDARAWDDIDDRPSSIAGGLTSGQARTIAYIDGVFEEQANSHRQNGSAALLEHVTEVRNRLRDHFPFLRRLGDAS